MKINEQQQKSCLIFRLFMTTRNPNPELPPDATAIVNEVNFTTTRAGLTGQVNLVPKPFNIYCQECFLHEYVFIVWILEEKRQFRKLSFFVKPEKLMFSKHIKTLMKYCLMNGINTNLNNNLQFQNVTVLIDDRVLISWVFLGNS